MQSRRIPYACLVIVLLAGGMSLFSGCTTTPLPETADAGGAVEDSAVVPTSAIAGDEGEAGPSTPEPADYRGFREGLLYEDYRIGARDLLQFRSLEDASLNSEVVVRYDGHISLPWVNDVRVAGLTREEAEEAVREAYAEFYEEPHVNLAILQANSKTFIVMGDVQAPGEFIYSRPVTLMESLNLAGGLRIYQQGGDSFVGTQGQLIKALIIRHVEEGREVFEFDLRGITEPGRHSADVPVMPGDIVFVPESVNLVYVLGQAGNGVFALTQGMTLLQLLATAGGFSESTARLEHVVLIREVDDANSEVQIVNLKKVLKTGQDPQLMPGDIIYLPRQRLVILQEFISRITGTITPVTNLYQELYDTYYTKERYDRLFEDNNVNNQADLLNLLQTIRDASGTIGGLPLIAGP